MTRPAAEQSPARNDHHSAPLSGEELRQRRNAVTALGQELRALVHAGVTTTVPTETLHQVADAVRRLAERLAGPPRPQAAVPEVDDFAAGLRFYNPVNGAGNPLAPPLRIEATATTVTGHCTLSPVPALGRLSQLGLRKGCLGYDPIHGSAGIGIYRGNCGSGDSCAGRERGKHGRHADGH